jgi:hypothetical protein
LRGPECLPDSLEEEAVAEEVEEPTMRMENRVV